MLAIQNVQGSGCLKIKQIYEILLENFERQGGKLVEQNNKQLKLQLQSISYNSEPFPIFLYFQLTDNTIKVQIRCDLTCIWAKIMAKGVLSLNKILAQINLQGQQELTFSIKQNHRILQCKAYFPFVQQTSIIGQKSYEILDHCKNVIQNIFQCLENKKQKDFVVKLQKCKQMIEYSRRKRIKSSRNGLMEQYTKQDLKDDKILKGCIKQREKLSEKLKQKMKKQPNIFRCFKITKIQHDELWKKKAGNNQSLQKYTITFQVTGESSMNKKTTQFIRQRFQSKCIPSDSQQSNTENQNFSQKTLTLTKKLIKKSQTQECKLSFVVEKKILAYLRYNTCHSINQYYCEEVDHLNDLTEFYSEYYENQINKAPINTKTFLKIIQTLCEGLCFLKENGVSHRDLKPDNILLAKNYNSKIIDFGSACHNKHSRLISPQFRIISHQLYTTRHYNIHYEELPYQVKNTLNSYEYENHYLFDIYAFGVIMQELLQAGGLKWQMGQILWQNITLISKWCQQKNPQDRPDCQQLYVIIIDLIKYFQI